MRTNNVTHGRPTRHGFTLIELLVVIAIIAILAAMILPALGKAKQKTQGIYCMNNGKQLMVAFHMYGTDCRDFFPPNPDDSNTTAGHNWCPGGAGVGGGNEFDPDILMNENKNLLAKYIGKNITVYKCPADKRAAGNANGDSASNPVYQGKKVNPVRTISMNQAVGTVCQTFKSGGSGHGANQPPVFPVDGPWLNNAHSHKAGNPWNTYHKGTVIGRPGAAMIWAIIDENTFGLNDAGFGVGMQTAEWIDYPGWYHNNACGFAFLDGHSEIHKWRAGTTLITPKTPGGPRFPANPNVDWAWISQHTSGR
jgi:prepilin-type N-terminal cleavage/methylation domain-containing protein/prepilin-type processing-associated H-X9-DG protein